MLNFAEFVLLYALTQWTIATKLPSKQPPQQFGKAAFQVQCAGLVVMSTIIACLLPDPGKLTASRIAESICIAAVIVLAFVGRHKLNAKYLNDSLANRLWEFEILAGSAFVALSWIIVRLFGRPAGHYKEFEDKSFVEYFLVGTFASVSIAVAIGLFIRFILFELW